jgi:hypothetical protein
MAPKDIEQIQQLIEQHATELQNAVDLLQPSGLSRGFLADLRGLMDRQQKLLEEVLTTNAGNRPYCDGWRAASNGWALHVHMLVAEAERDAAERSKQQGDAVIVDSLLDLDPESELVCVCDHGGCALCAERVRTAASLADAGAARCSEPEEPAAGCALNFEEIAEEMYGVRE